MIPALIGAVVCLVFIRSGFLLFLFLLPLGFIGYGWGPRTLWTGLGFAFLGNCILALVSGIGLKLGPADMAWEILYFTIMTVSFAWVLLPPREFSFRLKGPYRLAAGSLVCTVVFITLFFRTLDNPAFNEAFKNQIEALVSFYQYGTGRPEAELLPDINAIFDVLKKVILRGGALVSSILILFINQQISAALIRIFGGPRRNNVFMGFHTPRRLLLVFGISLILLPISFTLHQTNLEIILWNIAVLCVMMYLAQGFGILKFLLLKPNFPRFMRFIFPVLFFILLFSPLINIVLLGVIILLGIVENWVPFRVIKAREPPPTPGV